MKNLYSLSRTINKRFAIAAASSGIALAMSVGLLGTSAWLISMASTRPPVLVLEVAIVAVRFFGLSRGFFRYFGRLQEHGAVLNLQTKVRSKLYSAFESKLPAQLFGVQRGALLYQMVSDTESVLDLWIRVISPWLSALVSGVCGISIIYLLVPKAGIILGAIFIAAIVIAPFISYQLSRSESKSDVQEELMATLISTFDALPESIVFDTVEASSARVAALQAELNDVETRSSASAGTGDLLFQLASGASIVLALFFASDALLHHHLAGVNVAVLALLPLAIYDGATGLSLAFSELPAILESARRIESGLACEPEMESVEIHEAASLTLKDFLPEHLQLQPISLTAIPGRPILISGASGIGKSSLVHALAGLASYKGAIEVDGTEVRSLTPEIVTIGLQDDHLFQSSIRENLRIAREGVEDRELMQILEVVELGELMHSLPDGLDTHIGPLGSNFSGGERQRLKLARALLRHTPIFILDEPFEFLDALQAKRIAKRVSMILNSKIVIMISHIDLEIDGEHLHLSK